MTRNEQTAVREWNSAISVASGSEARKLVRALVSELDRTDDELDAIYDAHHINSATGRNLERLGNLVGVNRKTGESDSKYRVRIKAEFRQSTIETTSDEFIEFCAAVLQTNTDDIELLLDYDRYPARVTVSADGSLYESIDITDEEIIELFGDGVPAGHDVNVIREGTFRLKGDGEADDPDAGLTGDSTSSGGTLSGDL